MKKIISVTLTVAIGLLLLVCGVFKKRKDGEQK